MESICPYAGSESPFSGKADHLVTFRVALTDCPLAFARYLYNGDGVVPAADRAAGLRHRRHLAKKSLSRNVVDLPAARQWNSPHGEGFPAGYDKVLRYARGGLRTLDLRMPQVAG